MGVYDSIVFTCPRCRKEIVVQSKSGECNLNCYDITSVPLNVAFDANRHAPFKCMDCGALWRFKKVSIVELELEEVK